MTAMVQRLILLLALIVAGAQASEPDPDAGTTDGGGVALIEITGPIEPVQARYFKRALERARERGVATVVTHIDSPGGRLDSLLEMLEPLLAIDDAPRLVAYVDSEAISAAAALAYGHHEIHLTQRAKIGDIGVIFQTPGVMEYAPEKIETFMRAQLRTIGQVREWDEALLGKMTARTQVLYEVHHADGRIEFVLGRDLPRFLKNHPEIDRDEQVVAWQDAGAGDGEEDFLLTLTAAEAIDLGMATAAVDDLDALLQGLGSSHAEVIDLTPSTTELIARQLAGWAPLLLAGALLFVILELKTPGVGIWAALAGICGTAFFVCQYFLDLADHLEAVLIVLGLVLVIAELFTAFGGGVIGIGGLALMVLGTLLAFMPDTYQFKPGDERWAEALGLAVLRSLATFFVAAIGLALALTALPNTRLMKRLAVGETIAGNSAGRDERERDSFVGKRGVARDDLHPGGDVEIDGRAHSARSQHGAWIASGTPVEVVTIEFGELLVKACEADAPSDKSEAST